MRGFYLPVHHLLPVHRRPFVRVVRRNLPDNAESEGHRAEHVCLLYGICHICNTRTDRVSKHVSRLWPCFGFSLTVGPRSKWVMYLIYMVFCIISEIVVYFYVVETRARPVEEMAALFGEENEVVLHMTSDGKGFEEKTVEGAGAEEVEATNLNVEGKSA